MKQFMKPLSLTVGSIPYTRLLAVVVFVGLLLTACDDMDSVLSEPSTGEGRPSGALYVLCDGNYSLNNSTLALYDYTNKRQTNDFFQQKAGRKLGDTGNDLQRYGNRLYVVVNASSQLEVLDAQTGTPIKQIALFNGTVARQPRYVAFWAGKAYVCSFDGSVARIDTATLTVEAYVNAGRNPDGIDVANGKLYVSNSGGLDYNSGLGYDNTVSVIDITSFTEIERITVGQNPYRVKTDDYGYVWVACRGNYGTEAGSFWCINSQSDRVAATYPIAVLNMAFNGELAYLYHYDSATGQSWIKVFNLVTRTLERDAFITDGTQVETPYGIYVEPASGDVYITDAGNFTTTGRVLCFNAAGKVQQTLTSIGINPNAVVYVPDFKAEGTVEEPVDSLHAYIETVFAYQPAPGQFVGKYPEYATGDNVESMRVKAERALKGRLDGLVSLGRFGGSLTFAFRKPVVNRNDGSDFKLFGNAFTNGAEPGIVSVSLDVNGNGLPDDAWYELAGSEYNDPLTVKGYRLVYYRPSAITDSVRYSDNHGGAGVIKPGYPAWMPDSTVCEGSLLAPTASQDPVTGYWLLKALPWGYADNQPNASALCGFDLNWAVNSQGQPVQLDSVHFIRVTTAVNQEAGWIGELSTEISGAQNLRP